MNNKYLKRFLVLIKFILKHLVSLYYYSKPFGLQFWTALLFSAMVYRFRLYIVPLHAFLLRHCSGFTVYLLFFFFWIIVRAANKYYSSFLKKYLSSGSNKHVRLGFTKVVYAPYIYHNILTNKEKKTICLDYVLKLESCYDAYLSLNKSKYKPKEITKMYVLITFKMNDTLLGKINPEHIG